MRGEVLKVEDLWARYSKKQSYILKGIDFSLKGGEIVGVLGPSGSGKSTLLKTIAGIVPTERGRVYIDGKDVTNLPPNKRNLGVVFQSFALFPHMTVGENIAYGLKLRSIPLKERERKVEELLKLIGLEGFKDRYPSQLSGGQQQRVALARALAIDPPLILMDEPMSNIDPIFRSKLRQEVRRLLKEKNVTALYITHDRDDAFEISDRIAVMREGMLEQFGRPEDLVSRPKNRFVAEFLGMDNIVEVKCDDSCKDEGEVISLHSESYSIALPKHSLSKGGIVFGISKQKLRIEESKPRDPSWMFGRVVDITFIGSGYSVLFETKLGDIKVFSPDVEKISVGRELYVSFSPRDVVFIGD
ncbi:MAG: spermidine/putrescine ABC transporter ATP-binding protein [Fervidicoccus sp.]|nr:MAG: spermidine/putrescine ABC transporter ATP-binding protein [Fervidicoccus sp.]